MNQLPTAIRLEMAEETDQDNDWDWNAQHQQENGSHREAPKLPTVILKLCFGSAISIASSTLQGRKKLAQCAQAA